MSEDRKSSPSSSEQTDPQDVGDVQRQIRDKFLHVAERLRVPPSEIIPYRHLDSNMIPSETLKLAQQLKETIEIMVDGLDKDIEDMRNSSPQSHVIAVGEKCREKLSKTWIRLSTDMECCQVNEDAINLLDKIDKHVTKFEKYCEILFEID